MGSGGTTALLPPDKFFFKCRTLTVLSGADTQSRTGDLTLTKGALYQLSHISTLNLMPGSSLLSHGETPHYHRRYGVSLLSSAWGSGGTTALRPPGKFCCRKRIFYTDAALAAFVKSVTYFSMLLPFLHLPSCLSVKSFVPDNL